MDNGYLQGLPEYKIFEQWASLVEKEQHKWLVRKVGPKMARRLEDIDYMARRQVENAIIHGFQREEMKYIEEHWDPDGTDDSAHQN